MSPVCARMSSVCHPYVTRIYSYVHVVILMYFNVTRMSHVCSRMSPVFIPMPSVYPSVVLPLTYNNSVYYMIFSELCVLALSGD